MNEGHSPRLPGSKASRLRLAVVLLLMFATILAGKFWEEAYLSNLRRDCVSLYEDRLMPATTLFRLGDQIQHKREALEEFLHDEDTAGKPSLDYRLGKYDAAIEALLDDIEQTYLVDEESKHLGELHKALVLYDQQESELIKRHRSGEDVRYDRGMRSAFSQVRAQLMALTHVQEKVGQELNKDSRASASHVTSLLYFQLGITFILGLLASGLAMSLEAHAKVISRKPTEPDLH